MASCKHRGRIAYDVKFKYVDVRVAGEVAQTDLAMFMRATCQDCGAPFLFKGDAGFNTNGPTTSIGSAELRAPMLWPEDPVVKPVGGN